jgi:succinate-semialdehyde dehydrogenase/glutarate-semialdehyde dehydrogenase
MKMITTVDPYTGIEIQNYECLTKLQLLRIIESSNEEFLSWQKTAFAHRARLLLKCSEVLLNHKNELALKAAQEMGKPIKDGIAEIEKCALLCSYYAKHGEDFLKDEYIKTGVTTSYVCFRPLGVIFGIMPWNFPFWQVFRFIIPTIFAGNACLLKHASNVTGCAMLIQKIMIESGFPDHIFRSLIIKSDQARTVIAHPYVKAVTLTGSEQAGAAVSSYAASCIKPALLELGGNDGYIILADADIDHATQQCAQSRMINGGQSCIAAKRFIVLDEIHDEFVNKLCEALSIYKVGDPKEITTNLGPLSSIKQKNEIARQVEKSISMGAKLVYGLLDNHPENAFLMPIVLTDVKKGMPAYHEEVFGPVASVIKVKDETEAIKVANDTIFGLGAGIFTKDIVKGEHIARYHLNAGSCFVNHFVKSDPRLPFGGINTSGFGRELGSFGIRAFTNIKSVSVL